MTSKMFHYLLFLIFTLQTTVAVTYRPAPGGRIFSRDAVNPDIDLEVSTITQRINELIKTAKSDKGITFGSLRNEAKAIKVLALNILNQLKATVSEVDLKTVLKEASLLSKFDEIFSPFINDPLTYESRSMNVTLLVLKQLGKRLESQLDSTENYKSTLAAIAWNCDFITDILKVSEDFAVVFIQDPPKQRTTTLNDGYSDDAEIRNSKRISVEVKGKCCGKQKSHIKGEIRWGR